MPSLNQVQFLERAVTSVLEQADGADIELIVADGGSTDGTLLLLDDLSRRFRRRLRWFSRRDSGPAEAVNRAMALSEAEIIGWLNSDDEYAPDCISRTLQEFHVFPETEMCYGQAVHIDEFGSVLGSYPTLPSSEPLQTFADGNFICQPTVFIRRALLERCGYLDQSYKTAFDFDMWVRVWKSGASVRVINAVQARSRLHPGCITSRERRTVALEGMRIIAQHIGTPPIHWALTYVDELSSIYPFGREDKALLFLVEEFLSEALPLISSADDRKLLVDRLQNDERLRLATAHVYVGVYPDGWAGQSLIVRCKARDDGFKGLVLDCIAGGVEGHHMECHVHTQTGQRVSHSVESGQAFQIALDLDSSVESSSAIWEIVVVGGFVPSEVEAASNDTRLLTFKVVGVIEKLD